MLRMAGIDALRWEMMVVDLGAPDVETKKGCLSLSS